MPTRLPGQAFGPGFATAGSAVEFDVGDYGLTLVTEESFDGTPPWSDVGITRQGYGGLLLEWPGRRGRYAIRVADAAAVRTLEAMRPTAFTQPGGDRATRAWVRRLIFGTVVLPLLLIGLALWQHERIAGWVADQVPVAQERRVGELLFARTKAQLTLVEGPAAQMVRDIGARLTRGSTHQYEFYVAHDPSVNAFAMPGGFVVVHSGLLALATTPEEVAGVLAHEVSHVENRHSLRAMIRNAGFSALLRLAFGDTAGLLGMADQLADLKFSRDDESQADRDGLAALVKAGIRPQGMRDFFRKMAAGEGKLPGWLSTHPGSSERYAALDSAIAKLPASTGAAPVLPYDYAAIRASLPGRPASKEKQP
ncbi:MAG TPA: M48 family metallopeptidase [Burkholderiales bacterium]